MVREKRFEKTTVLWRAKSSDMNQTSSLPFLYATLQSPQYTELSSREDTGVHIFKTEFRMTCTICRSMNLLTSTWYKD